MDDFDDDNFTLDDLEPDDQALFNIEDIRVGEEISKNCKKRSLHVSGEKPISDMRLYLTLDLILRRLEKKLGIHDEDPKSKH